MESIRCAGCDRLLFRKELGALAGKGFRIETVGGVRP